MHAFPNAIHNLIHIYAWLSNPWHNCQSVYALDLSGFSDCAPPLRCSRMFYLFWLFYCSACAATAFCDFSLGFSFVYRKSFSVNVFWLYYSSACVAPDFCGFSLGFSFVCRKSFSVNVFCTVFADATIT